LRDIVHQSIEFLNLLPRGDHDDSCEVSARREAPFRDPPNRIGEVAVVAPAVALRFVIESGGDVQALRLGRVDVVLSAGVSRAIGDEHLDVVDLASGTAQRAAPSDDIMIETVWCRW
jgi:hypothetical protein